jgi:hypothetical protein
MRLEQVNVTKTQHPEFEKMDPTQQLRRSIMDVLGLDSPELNRDSLTSGIAPLEQIRNRKQILENQVQNENTI